MRAALLLAVLAMAGCVAPQDPEVLPEPSRENTPPLVLPAPVNETQSVPATANVAGLHVSECAFRDDAFFFKHEWADGVLPPEYRPFNYQAGNVGSLAVQVRDCPGMSIGNSTFLAAARIAMFAVPVEAPADIAGPGTNAYLFNFLTDSQALVSEMAFDNFPVLLADFREDPRSVSITAGHLFDATVSDLSSQEQVDNFTSTLRMHWKAGNQHCWIDVDHRVINGLLTENTLVARAGDIATLAGPARTLAGVGTRGIVSEFFGGFQCQGA